MAFMPETPRFLVHTGEEDAAICVVACAFVARFVTETKGCSLEQIESDLQESAGLVSAEQPQGAAAGV
jgi:hypothetical protein